MHLWHSQEEVANFGLWIELVLYERSVVAGRGASYANDRLWLEGPVQLNRRFMNETCPEAIRSADRREAVRWIKRRDMLAEHREYCKDIKGK